MADVSRVAMARTDVSQPFAEFIGDDASRKHIGCVMGLGDGWIVVSMPELLSLPSDISIRFLPSRESFRVCEGSRAVDRARLVYRTD